MSYAPASASEAQRAQQRGGRSSASRLEPAAVYKRMVIAMRSLFSFVRVLPTYRLYKACTVSFQSPNGCAQGIHPNNNQPDGT